MNKTRQILILLIPFGVYLAVGIILLQNVGYLGEELSVRSGVAYDLLKGDERGREGLICSVWWAPLPTLLQLILGFYPSLIQSGIAGIVISAFGGAMMCFFLFKSLSYLGVRRIYAYFICALAGLNPWILFFSATGASEALLLGIFAGALWGFLIWHFEQRLSGLVTMSLFASLLPLIKHHAILLSVAILLAGVTTALSGGKNRSRKAEGTIFLAISPTIYSAGLWFLFNWLIMGDFVYFLKGIYINPVELQTSGTEFISGGLKHLNPWLVQWFVMPILPVAVIIMVVTFFQKQGLLAFKYLAMLAVLPLYHVLMNSRHQSFNIAGDMTIAVPICLLVLGVFIKGLVKSFNPAIAIISIFVVILTALGTLFSYGFIVSGNMDMPFYATADFPFVAVKEISEEEMQIKDFILGKEEDSKIAVVGFSGYNFIRNSNGGNEFVHTINLDMRRTLRNTRGKTLYFIIPKPNGAAAFDSINLNLPGLYYSGETAFNGSDIKAHFMLESKDFPNWRIFTIVRPGQNESIFGTPKEITKDF